MPTMSTLSLELLSRELHSTDSTQLFTLNRRQTAIVKGEREFARLTKCIVRQTSLTCSNGVREYNLLSTASSLGSSDYREMAPQGPEYRLVSSNSTASGSTKHIAGQEFPRKDIERMNRETPGWRDSSGASLPQSWYLRRDGGNLYFGFQQPPTIKSSEVGTLMVPYVAAPDGSTSTGAEPFTINSTVRLDLRYYHQGLVHYAAHELEKLRPDMEASDVQLRKFMSYVQSYIEDQRPKGGRQISLGRMYYREASRIGERVSDPRT
jgi:hypothetical protein